MNLSVKDLAAMQPGDRAAAGRSIYVRRNADQTYSATIRVRRDGRLVERTLMSFDTANRSNLDQVAKTAEQARAEIQSSPAAPAATRTEAQAAALHAGSTVADVYGDFSAYCVRAGLWNERNAIENQKRIDRHLKPSALWKARAASVTALQLSDWLSPIKATVPDQAGKLQSLMRGVMTHALAARVIDTSPAPVMRDLMTRVKRGAPKAHFHALTDPQELKSLMLAIESMGQASASVRDCLKLQLLTCQRTSEVLNARWREFDLANSTWTIPRSRMKIADASRPDHVIPLPPTVANWLKAKHARWLAGKPKMTDDLVFPSPRNSDRTPTDDAVTKAMRLTLAMNGKHVPHGCRASIKTLSIRETHPDGSPRFAIAWTESLLDHVAGSLSGDQLRGSYDRGQHVEGVLRLLTWWADLLLDGRLA